MHAHPVMTNVFYIHEITDTVVLNGMIHRHCHCRNLPFKRSKHLVTNYLLFRIDLFRRALTHGKANRDRKSQKLSHLHKMAEMIPDDA